MDIKCTISGREEDFICTCYGYQLYISGHVLELKLDLFWTLKEECYLHIYEDIMV